MSFVLGVAVLMFLLVFLLYNIILKSIDTIPGLGFLQKWNRMGLNGGAAVGTAGFSGLIYSLVRSVLGLNSANFFRISPDEPTICIPITSWDDMFDTHIPRKYVSFGLLRPCLWHEYVTYRFYEYMTDRFWYVSGQGLWSLRYSAAWVSFSSGTMEFLKKLRFV